MVAQPVASYRLAHCFDSRDRENDYQWASRRIKPSFFSHCKSCTVNVVLVLPSRAPFQLFSELIRITFDCTETLVTAEGDKHTVTFFQPFEHNAKQMISCKGHNYIAVGGGYPIERGS